MLLKLAVRDKDTCALLQSNLLTLALKHNGMTPDLRGSGMLGCWHLHHPDPVPSPMRQFSNAPKISSLSHTCSHGRR
jgi:hypothetical protein